MNVCLFQFMTFPFKFVATLICRSFEEVPWDNMLAPKLWAPTSTLEERPDMISQTYTLHRYDPAAKEWQVM